MTRNEAENKIKYNIKCPNDLLCCLEKLGLIKFDEEKQIKSPSVIIHDIFPGIMFTDCDRIVNALMEGGYRIVTKKELDALR